MSGVARREPAQVMVIFALGMIGLLGLVGLVLDGGTVYVQRRTAQNAADAAALAGARALRYATLSPDLTVAAEVCKYTLANAFGVTPSATASFVKTDASNDGAIALPSGCTGSASNTIPSDASGVHVDVTIGPFPTYLVGLVGPRQTTAQAHATAQVGLLRSVPGALAPVAGCGPMMFQSLAGLTTNILGGNGTTVPYSVLNTTPPVGLTFVLQSSQLWKNEVAPPCPAGSGNSTWKGTIDTSSTVGVGSNPSLVGGNAAAPLDTACSSTGQAVPTPSTSSCYLAVPITDGNNPPGQAHIVTFACMNVFGVGTGTAQWTGTLVDPASCPSYGSYSNTWTPASGSGITRVALSQ